MSDSSAIPRTVAHQAPPSVGFSRQEYWSGVLFSSRSCIVSGLTFRSLIHFEFIFVYGVRKCSSFIFLLDLLLYPFEETGRV